MLTCEMAKAGSGASRWGQLVLATERAEEMDFVGSENELEMEAFRMASGGDANWRVARDEGLQQILLGILCKWLEAQDLGEKDLDGIVEGQRLRLLRRLLEAAGDPDREFLRDAEEGLPVGIRYPLPRTPHVFEEQLRWPLDNQPWEPGLRWVPNYSSVEEHVKKISGRA